MPANKKSTSSRRKFIADSAKVAGSAVLLSSPLMNFASPVAEAVTVGQIMDLFISQVKGAPFPNTVDTLKSGNREMVVTGVVTAMFAIISVIEKAIDLGANFIIAHEPTFYNHEDTTEWLSDNEVYQYKAALLKQHNIAVWRNHDYIHSLHPDAVRSAVVKQLEWNDYGDPDQPVFNLKNAVTLKALIAEFKTKLGIQTLRYVGNLEQPCQKVILVPGAAGRVKQIIATAKNHGDVLICGEISEWETGEYMRDANAAGKKVALIVLGHIASEEPGSIFMRDWVKTHFTNLKTTFVRTGALFSYM